ncbi:DUF6114 domain-containing protein [Lentzea sp. BCCO 10_0856]|uniref:DUF6114 domain-containing protein n=1 Tax=Lentzea miocenica TaxID=3095431 RepID=A0ABU4SY89_9PSEU|nr:DUF6114 domain-containing protein [Lentzea sp. BCCO 10_0856]MDX8030861.1 DUF6114 domain-containing protein [Lentzea sp. BCCO 10_0856]
MLLRIWRAFTAWRRGRPFWAGLFVAGGAFIIMFPPFFGVKLGDIVISIQTLGGVSALMIGSLLAICAVSLWVAPKFRLAAGIVTVLLSLVALVVTNMGGFLFGTILSLLGGALAVAWTNEPKEPKKSRKAKREDSAELESEPEPEPTQRVHPT